MLRINSVHDFQTFPVKTLEKELGTSVAQRIQKFSFGEDNSPVTPSGPPQSFSEEDTFKKCSSEAEAKTKIEELLSSLLKRVCHDGRKPHTIRLVIRRYSEKHCNRESRQCPIPSHVIQKLGTGNYDAMTPLVNILMKLFGNMQMQADSLSPREAMIPGKQVSAVSPCEPGTSGLGTSGSSHPSYGKDCSYYIDNQLKDERTSQGPRESQGFHFSYANPAVSVFHSFPNLQSEQLFSKHRTADSHKQTVDTTSHQGLVENKEQDSADEKLTFPSDIDRQVFYELPEEVQMELMAEWKAAGTEYTLYINKFAEEKAPKARESSFSD
ncbi:DNA polymerase iota isoform X4 [Sigmodon hispidus]